MNEWETEPDFLEFTYRGYDCFISRNKEITGALCGYVVLPLNHPLIPEDGDYMKLDNMLDVHGGITYGQFGEKDGKEGYLIGFDCAHMGDYCPARAQRVTELKKITSKYDEKAQKTLNKLVTLFEEESNFFQSGIYRNIEYVTEELHKLVDQIIAFKKD